MFAELTGPLPTASHWTSVWNKMEPILARCPGLFTDTYVCYKLFAALPTAFVDYLSSSGGDALALQGCGQPTLLNQQLVEWFTRTQRTRAGHGGLSHEHGQVSTLATDGRRAPRRHSPPKRFTKGVCWVCGNPDHRWMACLENPANAGARPEGFRPTLSRSVVSKRLEECREFTEKNKRRSPRRSPSRRRRDPSQHGGRDRSRRGWS